MRSVRVTGKDDPQLSQKHRTAPGEDSYFRTLSSPRVHANSPLDARANVRKAAPENLRHIEQ
jgi:hypothetical protein